jgi:hypothetical protein
MISMSLIKIGGTFLNVSLVESVVDLFPTTKEDKIVVRFGPGEGDSHTFTGRDADDLRTWLNSKAINLHEVTDLDLKG